MKKIVIILLGVLFLASCKKTYTCTDSAGNITGEVKASSQNDAASICPEGTTAKEK